MNEELLYYTAIINMTRIINASPEFGKSKSKKSMIFLTSSKLNIHLVTIDDNGYPNVHPTWYHFDSTNKKYISKPPRSQKR